MLLLLTEWHNLSTGNVTTANSDMIHGALVISLQQRVSSHMSTGDVTTAHKVALHLCTGDVTTADRVALHTVYW